MGSLYYMFLKLLVLEHRSGFFITMLKTGKIDQLIGKVFDGFKIQMNDLF